MKRSASPGKVFLMFWQKDIETMPRADLEALQLERLKRIVRYVYERVPFYRKRLDDAGVNPDKIKTLSDIQYIPYTTKADIRDTYPFGLFAVPQKEIVRIHASSGTTGNPTVVGYTKNDLENWSSPALSGFITDLRRSARPSSRPRPEIPRSS